jgi:hypothetical protein
METERNAYLRGNDQSFGFLQQSRNLLSAHNLLLEELLQRVVFNYVNRFQQLDSAWRQAIPTVTFRGFPQYLQASVGIVPYIRPRPINFTLFPICLSPVILSFDVIAYGLSY